MSIIYQTDLFQPVRTCKIYNMALILKSGDPCSKGQGISCLIVFPSCVHVFLRRACIKMLLPLWNPPERGRLPLPQRCYDGPEFCSNPVGVIHSWPPQTQHAPPGSDVAAPQSLTLWHWGQCYLQATGIKLGPYSLSCSLCMREFRASVSLISAGVGDWAERSSSNPSRQHAQFLKNTLRVRRWRQGGWPLLNYSQPTSRGPGKHRGCSCPLHLGHLPHSAAPRQPA